MPNVKIYVEEAVFAEQRAALIEALPSIRALLAEGFNVDVPAFQFAVMPVVAMPDLPLINVELHILPKPERTRAAVLAVCADLRALIEGVAGCRAAIRVMTLDPETYIALK
ncbi:MAG: hypothetical protein GC186_10555 [Rhodobacteraceae bacterium]|nr:hypothetical protein [Paracoccaceae bacterium]